VSGAVVHPMALRSPWYACERSGIDRFDQRAAVPVIQKFDSPEYVRRLLADPSASLKFGPRDVWTFPVPRRAADPVASFRERLSPYRLASSTLRKLYQPSHGRFYSVAVELFCDTPGLPRPGPDLDVSVGFVVRRLVTTTGTSQAATDAVQQLVRAASGTLYGAAFPKAGEGVPDTPVDPSAEQVEDLAAIFGVDAGETEEQQARHLKFEEDNRDLIRDAELSRELQAWYVDDAGVGGWQPVPGPDDPPVAGVELELPMWRVPGAACPGPDGGPGPQRSLWFGAVPTFSGELDADGRPRLDDRSTYVLQCVARRARPGCPPLETRSAASRPYRLAAFLDPAGTANQRVHVRMPDFAAVAAQAAQGDPAGGVVFERPPRSQLPVPKRGEIPTGVLGPPTGDASESCSFSIELITIVASFVLGLFLPVVVFAFQLWWMLLLKFCWPRSGDAANVLTALGTGSISGLTAAGRGDDLGRVLGADTDVVSDLFVPGAVQVKTDPASSKQFVQAAAPVSAPDPPDPQQPEDPVTDPLCPPPALRLR
jgi:hypothetical protein